MDIVQILIWVCLGLIAVSLLMMVVFGLKNSVHRLGGESKLGLLALLLPVIILVVAYAVSGSWTAAAIMAALFTALSGFVALIIAGAKSLVS